MKKFMYMQQQKEEDLVHMAIVNVKDLYNVVDIISACVDIRVLYTNNFFWYAVFLKT